MEGERPPEDQLRPESQEHRRVYPPAEVQARLEVSASGLRRLAGIYERTVGPLPRDERGRVWPEDAVEVLEDARAMVRESRAVSVEAALRGRELDPGTEPYPATRRPREGDIGPGEALIEELRALRLAIEELTRREEEHTRRISELEEAVRTGRELGEGRAATEERPSEGQVLPPATNESATVPGMGVPPAAPDVSGKVLPAEEGSAPVAAPDEAAERDPRETGFWRRVAAWFGFGVRRS